MKSVRLVAIDDAMLRATSADLTALESRYGVKIGQCADAIRDILLQTEQFYKRSPRSAPWIGYLVVGAGDLIVGTCGFTSPPNPEREVEIAYCTFPAFERQGYGTATAREMIALCERTGTVAQAIAHTLPEQNSSTRILQRVGMSLAGEIHHPEDGNIWLWRKPIEPVAGLGLKPQSKQS